jgi:hypothetical protein
LCPVFNEIDNTLDTKDHFLCKKNKFNTKDHFFLNSKLHGVKFEKYILLSKTLNGHGGQKCPRPPPQNGSLSIVDIIFTWGISILKFIWWRIHC